MAVTIDANHLQALIKAATLSVAMEDAAKAWRDERREEFPVSHHVGIRGIAKEAQRLVDDSRKVPQDKPPHYDDPLTEDERLVLSKLAKTRTTEGILLDTAAMRMLRQKGMVELGAMSLITNWPGSERTVDPMPHHAVRLTARGWVAYGSVEPPEPGGLDTSRDTKVAGYKAPLRRG